MVRPLALPLNNNAGCLGLSAGPIGQESTCDPEGVVGRLRPPSHFNPNPAVPWKTYPIALVLTGRQAEAVDFVRTHRQEVADKADMASKSHVEYAERFLERYP